MPLVHISGKPVFFFHVPRCGGSAIEDNLATRFGRLGFLDRAFLSQPGAERWTKCSPQHIEAAALDRLLPPPFFAARFAVVRHPIDRLVSVFRYNRDIVELIPADMSFDAWLADLPSRLSETPHYLDNHPRPMTQLVHPAAKIFRLEDGMAQVVEWLDNVAGERRQPRKIGIGNSYHQRMEAAGRPPTAEIEVTARARALIAEIYAADFERFGYAPRPDRPAETGTADPQGNRT